MDKHKFSPDFVERVLLIHSQYFIYFSLACFSSFQTSIIAFQIIMHCKIPYGTTIPTILLFFHLTTVNELGLLYQYKICFFCNAQTDRMVILSIIKVTLSTALG